MSITRENEIRITALSFAIQTAVNRNNTQSVVDAAQKFYDFIVTIGSAHNES